MFSLIPKTDAGLWLGPVGFSPPVALYPGTVRSELMGFFLFFVFFFCRSSSSWQCGSHVNYYYALGRV